MDVLLVNVVLNVLIPTIVLSPVLWLAGRALVGKEKAKFTDAIWIILLGTLFGSIFSAFFTGIIASIVQLIVWLALVKHLRLRMVDGVRHKHSSRDHLHCHCSVARPAWIRNLDHHKRDWRHNSLSQDRNRRQIPHFSLVDRIGILSLVRNICGNINKNKSRAFLSWNAVEIV